MWMRKDGIPFSRFFFSCLLLIASMENLFFVSAFFVLFFLHLIMSVLISKGRKTETVSHRRVSFPLIPAS